MEISEEITTNKISLAGSSFKSKNYSKCLALYDEIISTFSSYTPTQIVKIRRFYNLTATPIVGSLCHPKLATVLDQRAATFEKLGKFDNAFSDASRIMSLDPLDCKGYLRGAKLRRKQNKLLEAYKILQKGAYIIEKAVEKYDISVSESLFLLLRTQYSELNTELKRSKAEKRPDPVQRAQSTASKGLQRRLDEMIPLKRANTTSNLPKRVKTDLDPVYRLPKEVIETIFLFVPIRALLRCHLVCKSWYHVLTSLPMLYRNVFALKHRVTAPEYYGGLKLMKKVASFLHRRSVGSIKLWSTYNTAQLSRILENILSDETLRLETLELLNRDLSFELLLNKAEKLKWACLTTLAYVTRLRMGINSSLVYPDLLLKMFPNLESLDVIIIDSVLTSANRHLLPETETFHLLLNDATNLQSHSSLKTLLLVNNPALTRDVQKMRPNSRTFNPQPPFLRMHFPNLVKLTLTSFDFTNLEAPFGQFLLRCPLLNHLYMENNAELSLRKFFTVLRLYDPAFKLESFTFREPPQDRPYSLNDIDGDSLSQFHQLRHVDLYGCCLSGRGLVKFLSLANHDWKLKSLNIGNGKFLFFRKDKFVAGHEILEFAQLFKVAPQLEILYMNELDLDDLSMKCFHKDLVNEVGYAEQKLRKLDLSFCYSISGIGVMNLLNLSYSQITTAHNLILDELILDGLDVSKESVTMITRREVVKTVRHDPLKTKWKQYGVNTLVQDR